MPDPVPDAGDAGADQAQPMAPGAGPVGAGAPGSAPGNLPPNAAPSAGLPVAALGAQAKGVEMIRAAMQLISMSLPLVGISTPDGEVAMKILHMGQRHFKTKNSDSNEALMTLLKSQLARAAGAVPGAGPPGAPPGAGAGLPPPPMGGPPGGGMPPPAPPRGPIPQMTGALG